MSARRTELSVLAALALVASLSCDQRESAAQQRSKSPREEVPTRARELTRIRMRDRSDLVESSGAAMSSTQPGVLFTINDSGNEPLLFAVDTMGASRGTWRVQNAQNVDWEAVSIGTCGSPRTISCVYIGDVGDNLETIPVRAIYRTPEPSAGDRNLAGAIAAERLVFRYADGPHDVEAMYVAPNGDVVLITKRRRLAADRRMRPALVFTLPASAWGAGKIAVATLTDSLPIVPGSARLRTITDAALSPDARLLAVRTYAEVYTFAVDSATGRPRGGAPSVCDLTRVQNDNGEGITWVGRTNTLLLTGEGRREPMYIVRCPLPKE
jgi:hypothetical protein